MAGTLMCDEGRMPGFVSRQWSYAQGRRLERKDRDDLDAAVRRVLGGQQQRGQTPTEFAYKLLAVVGCVLLVNFAGFILHALLYTVVVLACLVAGTVGGLVWWRVHPPRSRRVVPGPLPQAPARTVVTGVEVRGLRAGGVRAAIRDGQRQRRVS